MTYDVNKIRVSHYSEFSDRLSDESSIKKSAARSKAVRDSYFFVYHGDIEQERIQFDLTHFYPNKIAHAPAMPFAYPIVLGDVRADEIYFHGYVAGSITCRNFYAEKYAAISTPDGCAGQLSVAELCLLSGSAFHSGEPAHVGTLVLAKNASLESAGGTVRNRFVFASAARKTLWQAHGLDEIKAHFNDQVSDEMFRLEQYYGVDIDAMLPMMPEIADSRGQKRSWLKKSG